MPGAGDGGVRDCAGLSARDAATLACGGGGRCAFGGRRRRLRTHGRQRLQLYLGTTNMCRNIKQPMSSFLFPTSLVASENVDCSGLGRLGCDHQDHCTYDEDASACSIARVADSMCEDLVENTALCCYNGDTVPGFCCPSEGQCPDCSDYYQSCASGYCDDTNQSCE